MDQYGVDFGYLFIQCLSFGLLAGWIILGILALVNLKNRRLEAIPEAIWALMIVLVPVLGAVALWIVNPQTRQEHIG